MQNRKYYLFYLDSNGVAQNMIINQYLYRDITEIDLITLDYTKDEFIQKYLPGKEVSDLFIGRLTFNKKEKKYDFHFYECFFKEEKSSLSANKVREYMKTFALERLKKTSQKGTIQLDAQNIKYREYISFLLQHIISDRELLFAVTHSMNLTDYQLKEYLLQYTNSNTKLFDAIVKRLNQYKALRSLSMEFLNLLNYRKVDYAINYILREQYQYSSLLFDFYNDFPMTIDEANVIPNKEFVPKYLKIQNAKIAEIMRTPFDSKEIESFYELGGIEEVLNHMDTNRLYESTDEDLLRLGLITEEDYQRKKGGLHKK